MESGAAEVFAASGLGVTFANGTAALAGVSLTVQAGELVALLGPSGCGKSTLLRVIAGLLKPTAGGVRSVVADATPGEVGFVFQDPTLMPWATVQGNVALPLLLAGVGRRERADRARAAIARVGLGGFEESHPRQLSGGMRMRVSLARALVTKPRLLLLDEPFAALDEITRARLNDDLLRLWAEERLAVVFVTHSVYESAFLASRVLVMSQRPGRIVAEETIDLPYPRPEGLRTDAAYAAHCRRLSSHLAAVMA